MNKTNNLQVSFASWDYDLIRPLIDRTVKPDGLDLIFVRTFPAETFPRMIQHEEFDVCEMGFKFCEIVSARPDARFIGIPAFPVRLFPHSLIYVNKNSGIKSPRDLIGKRIGEPYQYGHDAAIWARGMLSDEYDVPVDSVTYCIGALDETRRRNFAPLTPPANVRVEHIRPEQNLDAMLESGEIDALYCAMVPPCVLRNSPNVTRLFEDYEQIEKDYFRKTRIFPIVHFVALRRELYLRHKWIAQSLYKAFKDAKAHMSNFYREQEGIMHRLFMLPWLSVHQNELREVMGEDWWPYGLEPNRKTIETFLRYHREQGFSSRLLKPEELFAPETLHDHSRFG